MWPLVKVSGQESTKSGMHYLHLQSICCLRLPMVFPQGNNDHPYPPNISPRWNELQQTKWPAHIWQNSVQRHLFCLSFSHLIWGYLKEGWQLVHPMHQPSHLLGICLTPPHDAWQTNGFFVYTGAALPDPAVVVVQRRFLPHLLEDLLSLQLSPWWALVLLEAPLGRTSLPDAV